mmetsp:Transcript_12009/g.41662  ORF Transcript_12009/g.41662 Transcript_12009/m.41662 type:complete len:208 (-) Transcript_12009:1326-1949(-)
MVRALSFFSALAKPSPGTCSGAGRLLASALDVCLARFLAGPSLALSAPSSSMPSASGERSRLRLCSLPSFLALASLARSTAAVGSMPTLESCLPIRSVFCSGLPLALERGTTGTLFAADFLRRWSATRLALRCRSSASSAASSGPSSSSSSLRLSRPAASACACSSSSSRSSSASRASISGSTKSATFLPSMISGTTSYRHSSCSSR